jgi:membrane protein YdbS with pleckstrin-like domain
MTQADRPHRPADDKEEIYFQGSPMLRFELASGWLWVLVGIVIAIAPILIKLVISPNTHIIWWVYLVAIVIGLIFALVPWIKSKTIRYRITNYRIDFERGLLSRTIDTIELWHVEDLKLRQSILHRLLDVGSIQILSRDETNPSLYLNGIPNPRQLFQTLEQRIIAVKRQRGVVKMDLPPEPPVQS